MSVADRVVLRDVDFTWHRGQHWVLCGSAGSGKSALAEVIAGQLLPTRGERRYPAFEEQFPDARWGVAPRGGVRMVSHRIQRQIALQHSTFHQARWHSAWTEPLTVQDFLEPPRVLDILPYEFIEPGRIPADFEGRRRSVCVRLGIEPLRPRRVASLSNGELRRLLLARAGLARPSLLVLDDPLGGLDPPSRIIVTDQLSAWATEGMHLLITSPRPEELIDGVTHGLWLDEGRVTASGSVARIFGSPKPLPGARAEEQRSPRVEESLLEELPPETERAVVVCRNLVVRAGKLGLLNGVEWVVQAGERWLVTGHNGSGKSTLLAVIHGDHPQVYCNDVTVCGLRLGPGTSVWQLRKRVGFMSPELTHHYPPGWSVLEVVLSGFEGTLGVYVDRAEPDHEVAVQWMADLGLRQHAEQPFGALSEGEQRCVLLARALVGSPRLLLLDEPTQGLGADASRRVLAAIESAVERERISLVLVTHYPEESPGSMTHHLELGQGRVVRRGRRHCAR